MFPKDGERFHNVDNNNDGGEFDPENVFGDDEELGDIGFDGDDKEFDLEKVFGDGEEFDDISLDYYDVKELDLMRFDGVGKIIRVSVIIAVIQVNIEGLLIILDRRHQKKFV